MVSNKIQYRSQILLIPMMAATRKVLSVLFGLFICLVLSPSFGSSIRLPFIDHGALIGQGNTNFSLLVNRTCDECLCLSSTSHAAVNCFDNRTCQLFRTFPLRYRINVLNHSRLYFPQGSFPNESECCMSNLTDLLNRLKNGSFMQSVNVSSPRDVVLDNRGTVATVESVVFKLSQFDATNLSQMNHIIVGNSFLRAFAFYDDVYYVASQNNMMLLVNAVNLSTLANLTLTQVSAARGIIFLNGGRTMVISSSANNSLVFFNRSLSIAPFYTFQFRQPVSYGSPHGLWRVNDSFFYVTSYQNNSVYSYRQNISNGIWIERFVFQVPKWNNSGGATHLTIDECDRFWLSLGNDRIIICDEQGNQLGNFTVANAGIYDLQISKNYLMYFADNLSNRIVRLDPNIQC